MRKCFLFAAAALMLVACSKEQSEFNSSDLRNDALPQGTVVGTVKYDAGAYKDANGVIFDKHFIPAAGQQVKIEVSNSSYVSGSTGNQVFLAGIGEDGKFSYTLPLGLAATNVKVSVVPFYAEKKVLVDGQIVSIPAALYNTGVGPTIYSMTNKDVKTYNFNVTSDATVEDGLSKTVTVTGKILLQQWIKDGTDYKIDNKSGDKTWKLTCKVTTWDNNGAIYQEYTKTGIQTNSEGEFTFSINLPDNWKNMATKPMLKISTPMELDKNFVGKYYDIENGSWKSQTCTVLYPVVEKSMYLTTNNDIVPVKYDDFIVKPELQDKAGVKGIGNMAIDKPEGTLIYNKGALNYTWNY